MKKELTLEGIIIEKGKLDSNGDQLLLEGMNITSKFIPVIESFKQDTQIGWAELYQEDNCIKMNTDLWVDNVKNDKLLDFYPAIGGMIQSRTGKLITDFKITSVSLSSIPNSDPSIKTLREQIKPKFPEDRIDPIYIIDWLKLITWLGIIGLTIIIWWCIFKWIF